MKKTLKVTQAICPCCHFRKPLENSDQSEQICVAAGTKTAA